MNWKYVKHRDLLLNDALRIAYLKDQHWPYGVESQILWMENNILVDDTHIMGEDKKGNKNILRAYATLSDIDVVMDDKLIDCIGVGGVCVDKETQHIGVGQLLLQKIGEHINERGQLGILLCKDSLLKFYEKNGWRLIHYKTALVADSKYKHNIMLLGEDCKCSNIKINKNF